MAEAALRSVDQRFSHHILKPIDEAGPVANRLAKVANRLREFYGDGKRACLLDTLRLAVARPRSRSTRSSRLSSGSLNLKSLRGKAGSIMELRDSLPKMQLLLWRAALWWHESVAIEMLFDVQLNP